MKKKLITTITLTLSTLFSACSTHTPNIEDTQKISYTQLKHPMPLKKFNHLIMQAGEEDGWRMTPFKENAVIAEKATNGETQAITVKFSKNYFHLIPQNNDLQNAIEDQLEKSIEK
jgi:hypothetical protein